MCVLFYSYYSVWRDVDRTFLIMRNKQLRQNTTEPTPAQTTTKLNCGEMVTVEKERRRRRETALNNKTMRRLSGRPGVSTDDVVPGVSAWLTFSTVSSQPSTVNWVGAKRDQARLKAHLVCWSDWCRSPLLYLLIFTHLKTSLRRSRETTMCFSFCVSEVSQTTFVSK